MPRTPLRRFSRVFILFSNVIENSESSQQLSSQTNSAGGESECFSYKHTRKREERILPSKLFVVVVTEKHLNQEL